MKALARLSFKATLLNLARGNNWRRSFNILGSNGTLGGGYIPRWSKINVRPLNLSDVGDETQIPWDIETDWNAIFLRRREPLVEPAPFQPGHVVRAAHRPPWGHSYPYQTKPIPHLPDNSFTSNDSVVDGVIMPANRSGYSFGAITAGIGIALGSGV